MGSLLADPKTSVCSKIGDVDDEVNEELALGNLEWLRMENVGVVGVEVSDAVECEMPEVCIESAVFDVTSSE